MKGSAGHLSMDGPAKNHRPHPQIAVPTPLSNRSSFEGTGHVPTEEWRAPHRRAQGTQRRPSPEFAFRRPAIQPLAPEAVFAPPADVLDALANAERVIVVSHVPPDGDCVGTALGVARALQSFGKQACAVVDCDLPANLKGLDDGGDLYRAADAPIEDADLVLLVDVAQADRIGEAKALLQSAPAVAVIDHHRADPNAQNLGLDAGTPVHAWVDEHADSASLMAAAAVRTLAERFGGVPDAWSHVTGPLAAGAATDTSWFSKSTTRSTSLPIFKFLLDGSPRRLSELRTKLTYDLPKGAQALLDRAVDVHVCSHHGHTAAWMSANERTLQAALREAQRKDPAVTADDISGSLMDRLDGLAKSHEVSVLLLGEGDGRVRISTRSRDPEAAGAVARALGGGGKHGAGGAVVDNASLLSTRRLAKKVLDQWVLGQSTSLRLRGS